MWELNLDQIKIGALKVGQATKRSKIYSLKITFIFFLISGVTPSLVFIWIFGSDSSSRTSWLCLRKPCQVVIENLIIPQKKLKNWRNKKLGI